jgi:hypothetical protein
MNLIWHIVRKDFRRLRLPLALWLVLLLGMSAWATGQSYARWEGEYFRSLGFGTFVQMLIAYVLAAWLVLEDDLVGTQAFWQTRPVSGARLLAAKSLGALLMLGVLPVGVLTPIWLWCGFAPLEWAASATETLLIHGGITVVAFALAAVSASTNQFMLMSVAAALAVPVCLAYAQGAFGQDAGSPGLADSRAWVIGDLVVAVPVVALVHQFLTRRTPISLLILIAGLALVPVVRLVWPWDFVTARRQTALVETKEVAPSVRFECAGRSDWTDANGARHIRVDGVVTGVPRGNSVRLNSVIGEWSKNGQRLVQARFLTTDGNQEAPAAWVVRQLAGVPEVNEEPMRWSVEARFEKDSAAAVLDPAANLRLDIAATLLRGRVLGELPVKVGAELKAGSDKTRIMDIRVRPQSKGRWLVYLRERDALPARLNGVYLPDGPMLSASASGPVAGPVADWYVLRDQTVAEEQLSAISWSSRGRANGIMYRGCTLDLTLPARPPHKAGNDPGIWSEPIMLTKVRFVAEHGLARSVEIPSFQPTLP